MQGKQTMTRRYVHADANLYSHIRTLRIAAGVLSVGLLAALLGWHSATTNQRVSIPPDLRYGGQVTLNSIHPWEVYNFTGYVWQQLNRCKQDCLSDYPGNLDRLTAFVTPAFKAWLRHDSVQRAAELKGRTRYLVPTPISSYQDSVISESPTSWNVLLDVELNEDIGGVPVKRLRVRFAIRVLYRPIDPESNPWGLLLDSLLGPPERIA